jgi:hypothetical protein
MDRSLDDMQQNKEIDDMLVEEAELEDLDRLGARLSKAYELSGEPPSLAAIEFAQSSVSLPERAPADVARFSERVRRRVDAVLRAETGASDVGNWVQQCRSREGIDEAAAAHGIGVDVGPYRQFERGRMPVWRLPARGFAELCKQIVIDVGTLLRWSSLFVGGASRGVYGRLEGSDEGRTDMLERLADASGDQSRAEFAEWRSAFMAAYEGPSIDDARPRR